RENLEHARDRRAINARELAFDEGEYVYLKVSPLRGTKRFRTRGKLAPRSKYHRRWWTCGITWNTWSIRYRFDREAVQEEPNTGMQGVMEQSLRKRGYLGKGVGTFVSSSLRE
ncbi:hypothetical protein U9M48_021923, partial [Paspalum notatum var. saurae]